nr:SMC family ATPase [Paenibacillus swuensis]
MKLAGLQSYREAQEIDFTELTEAGVFGIFGPTGSGKSSILDAITLALYGKVERAPLGTQGILNQFEQSLTVAFTFELTSASGKRRYRIERQYKRIGEVSVSNTVCRFVHILPEGEEVTADKQVDVNAAVEDLIGLSMQDFTRAVVLPQGKFAEFLSLKGSDRRQMLQRLFHLEAYGDVLNGRLNHRTKETNMSLKQTEAEQQGLGDASAEALQAAEGRLQLASESAQRQRKLLLEVNETYERLKRVRDRHQERANVYAQLEVLESSDGQIQEQERLLTLHAAAERLLPLLKDWQGAGMAVEDCVRKLEEGKRLRNEAESLHTQAEEACKKAGQELSLHEGSLILRLNQLKQAKELETEIGALRREASELTAKQTEAEGQLADLRQRIAKERAMLEKAIVRQAELQEALKGNEVRPEQRQRLHEASRQRHELLSLRKQQAALATEAAAKRAACHAQEQAASELLRAEQAGDAQLGALAAELAEAGIAADAGAAGLRELLAEAAQLLERERIADRERSAMALAAQLAAHLHDGTPCPVCGSAAHPQPAQGPEAAPADGGAAERLQQLLERLRGLSPEVKQLQLLHQGLAAQLAERLPAGGALAAAGLAAEPTPAAPASAADAEVSRLSATPSALSAEAALASLLSRTDELEESLNLAISKAQQHAEQLRTLIRHGEMTRRQRHEHEAELKASQGITTEVLRKYEEANRALLDTQKLWSERYADLPEEALESALEQLAEKDRQVQSIRESLEKSVPYIDQARLNIERLQLALADLDREEAHRKAIFGGKRELLQEKEERLDEWTGKIPADRLIVETTVRLDGLRDRVAHTKKESADTASAYQQLLQRWSMLTQALQSAQEQCDKLDLAWRQALETSLFKDTEQVSAALLSEAKAQDWMKAIREHRERQHALRGKLEHIDAQLQGAVVTESKWQEIVDQCVTVKEADEAALRELAKSERDLEELTGRHERWKGLEAGRGKLQELYNRLSQLQSVFRGNAFVEFIAEEQLTQVSRAASERLGFLTRQRYALEVDSSGGFVIRDDANGGLRRPVSTLSGGETFLTSLALALALSGQIQLRGEYPLEFFFLDEGFGTLDQDLLDTVITSLEKLHGDRLSVGVISHVPELRARLPRKLVVSPAESSGKGSRIHLETL